MIPGRGRLPLDEESVFCTLGVLRGEIKVPYEVNNKIEEALFTPFVSWDVNHAGYDCAGNFAGGHENPWRGF